MYYITIDAGTTNTRLFLVKRINNEVVAQVGKNFGIRNIAIDQSTSLLKGESSQIDASDRSKSIFLRELSEALREILVQHHCKPSSVAFIVASGMITSNLGLIEVPYVTSPCTTDELAKGTIMKKWPQFFNIPCFFIPGVRNSFPNDKKQTLFNYINQFDVMRGEEVETIGLIEQLQLTKKGLVILPGSHMKFILVDKQTIQSSLSSLSGEILAAIQQGTILTSSLQKDLLKIVEPELLWQGFQAGKAYGLTRSLYHIRLLDLFDELKEGERANYFVGAVLAEDLQALEMTYLNQELDWIVVGGRSPLRQSIVYLLQRLGIKGVIEATDEQVMMSTILGCKQIADLALAGPF